MEARAKRDGWTEPMLLVFALGAWAAATLHLMVLLWRFVPTHEALFAGMGATPTPGLRVAIGASHLMVRWLPLMVIATPVVLGAFGLAGGLSAARLGLSRRTVVRVLVALALAGAACSVLASFGIVHSIQEVHDRTKLDPRFERRP